MANKVKELQEFLVEFFEQKRDFRLRIAEEIAEKHPDQVEKNSRYAESLGKMISHIAALPEEDARLQQLASCAAIYYEWSGMFEFPSDPDGATSDIENWAVHLGPRGQVLDLAEVDSEFTEFVEMVLEVAPDLRVESDAADRELAGIDDDDRDDGVTAS